MIGDICPVCAKGSLVRKTEDYQTKFLSRGGEARNITVPDISREECDRCGEAFLDETASRQLEAARRTATGLLSAAEIRGLRQRLRMTQSEISELLGIGEKTYCRWESDGYVQSIAFDNYLRLVDELPEAIAFLTQIRGGNLEFRRTISVGETAVFPALPDASAFQNSAELFTRLLERGQLLAT
jgi:HTH-type transcriptional regulator / antitoxin MqsA